VTREILTEDALQNALEEFKEKGVVEFV